MALMRGPAPPAVAGNEHVPSSSARCHERTLAAFRGRVPLSIQDSTRCRLAVASWRSDPPPMASPSSGRRVILEKLWREFFSDPSQWWDSRSEKANARYPDFKHRTRKDGLWLDNRLNPSWVVKELASMAPGTLQLDIFSWNKKLVRCVKAGRYESALKVFQEMQLQGMNPNAQSFVPVLNACAKLRRLQEGRRIHSLAIQAGHDTDVYVGNSLVDMYAKCGSIADALRVFSKMPKRNVVTWSTMILRCAKCGEGPKALELSHQMLKEGIEPNPMTFVGILNACASLANLEEGRHVHQQIIERGHGSDVFVANSLIDMYAKCGRIEDAQQVFDKMVTRNVVSFSAMILGYVKCGEGQRALDLELFEQMLKEGVEPNPVTFVGMLNVCASVGSLEGGRRVHEHIIQRGYERDLYVANSLIDMYAKCGSIEDAHVIFKQMPTRDVISWNVLILGYVKCGEGQKALEFSQQMQMKGMVPDSATYVAVLNACASVGALEEGRRAHEQIIRSGCESDVFVGSSLIDMYSKCGSMEDACRVFKNMPVRNVITWNAMMLGYVKCGEGQRALDLFQQMQREGLAPAPATFVPVLNACASLEALKQGRRVHKQIIQNGYESDVFVCNSLIDMYAKCESIDNAWRVFKKMPTRDVISWNAMILGFVKCGQGRRALELSRQMHDEGLHPDQITFVGMLNACASVVALEEGRHVHEQILQRGFESDTIVGNSLIDMYAKCGSIEDAWRVFNSMGTRNMVSWSAMLAGYAMHGYAVEALEHFNGMVKEVGEVDKVTFVSLLSACSHGGLVDEGLRYFDSMISVYGISPSVEHYSCVVDLLGRAGRLNEAEDLIKTMSCEGNVTLWNSLLGACRIHGNVEMGERAARQVLELDPGNSAGYVLLSNIYAAAGKWDSSASVQQLRLERGVQKQPGRTWIELNNQIHSFIVGDQQHPQIVEIHEELDRITGLLTKSGYIPDTSFVLHDVDEEEKKVMLCHHSEKLAIAYGLLNTPPGTQLRIFKNLRVCGDCHTATKFIAKVVGREIIVRDANRFHHFQNGHCSCRDYW